MDSEQFSIKNKYVDCFKFHKSVFGGSSLLRAYISIPVCVIICDPAYTRAT